MCNPKSQGIGRRNRCRDGRIEMKLSRQECGLVQSVRGVRQHQLFDWAMTIEYRDGAWDVFIRGPSLSKRGVGSTFESAWDAFCKTELEEQPRSTPR